MSTWQKVVGFVVAAAVAFALAIGIGQWVGPIDGDDDEHGHADDGRIQLEPAGDGGHDDDSHDHGAVHSLALENSVYDAGRQELAFTVRDGAGEPLTSHVSREPTAAPPLAPVRGSGQPSRRRDGPARGRSRSDGR